MPSTIAWSLASTWFLLVMEVGRAMSRPSRGRVAAGRGYAGEAREPRASRAIVLTCHVPCARGSASCTPALLLPGRRGRRDPRLALSEGLAARGHEVTVLTQRRASFPLEGDAAGSRPSRARRAAPVWRMDVHWRPAARHRHRAGSPRGAGHPRLPCPLRRPRAARPRPTRARRNHVARAAVPLSTLRPTAGTAPR
jgi:hypothetical protein